MKILLLAFQSEDIAASMGLAHALGASVDVARIGNEPADVIADAVASVIGNYQFVVGLSSMRSKDVLPYVAGRLGIPAVTDVLSVVDAHTFKRPIYAGSMIATVHVESTPVALTFRANGFAKGLPETFTEIPLDLSSQSKVAVVSENVRGTGRPDLGAAKIVVSGGRPLKDAQTFESVIGGFADALGAAVGATRAAVDSGIAANELQVGQTGKVVAPDLYIAAGISGSTQHMAGIKDSKVIVAINTDANAPIFEAADLGLVGDLYQVLPELQQKLK